MSEPEQGEVANCCPFACSTRTHLRSSSAEDHTDLHNVDNRLNKLTDTWSSWQIVVQLVSTAEKFLSDLFIYLFIVNVVQSGIKQLFAVPTFQFLTVSRVEPVLCDE